MIKILILDLDGTTYDNSHRNHLAPRGHLGKVAANWEPWHAACAGDFLIRPVASVVRAMAADGWLVYVLTRRSDSQRYITEARLRADNVPFVAAEFASMHDNRPAPEFKAATVRNIKMNLERFAGCEYEIIALEDSPDVIDALEAEGVKTFQVKRPAKQVANPA